MKCNACPFHLVCFMGKLGWPYEVRLCPKCENLCFVIEEHIATVAQEQQFTRNANGDLFSTPKRLANGHVFLFKCEKRPLTDLHKAMYEERKESAYEALTKHGKMDSKDVMVQVEDTVSRLRFFQIRGCVGCKGQWDRAGGYYEVFIHELDNGDPMPEFLRQKESS